MYLNERPLIGVMVNQFDDTFEQCICSKLSCLANENGYNIVFFNSFGNPNSGDTYDDLESRMQLLAPIEQLDAIIALTDTYQIKAQHDLMVSEVRRRARKDIPIVSLRGKEEGWYSVLVDEGEAMKEMILHVIEHHRLERICFMSGTPGHPDAEFRIRCFYEIMSKKGLPIHHNAIFHGDFWKHSGAAAVEQFFSDPNWQPQAIICANDYMAISLYDELARRGIRVPQDVIITGFDDAPDSSLCGPPLTTLSINLEAMATVAIETIMGHWRGEPQPATRWIHPVPRLRDSCGCHSLSAEETNSVRNRFLSRRNIMFDQTLSRIYFQIDLSGCTSVDKIYDMVETNLNSFSGYKDFYLMLCADSEHDLAEHVYDTEISPMVRLAIAIKDRRRLNLSRLPSDELFFHHSKLLPNIACSKTPSSFYIVLLHNRGTVIGYSAINYEPGYIYDYTYQSWTVSLASAIDATINKMRLESALRLNEHISITDSLTGLLNRRGFERRSQERCRHLNHCCNIVSVISFDLDGLKGINDRYGHAAGDFALMVIADAIRTAFSDGITARTGGDEFVVLITSCDEKSVEKYLQYFYNELEKACARANKPYRISASIGYVSQRMDFAPDNPSAVIEQLLRESDRQLYVHKRSLRRRSDD
ncbi:MAG: GGDEF domain-containing protein [Ruminococcaceae bacterium]|nr:GGDEF domain-containing protein [Oscillospiraceae bacterium]